MELTRQEVEHVATLARLHVTEEEKGVLASELSRILDYAKELQVLDLTNVAATSQIGITQTVTRADEPHPSLPQFVVLANAPEEEDGMFRVPAVLEG